MRTIQTAIPDVLLFEPDIYGDDRGYFFESFRQDLFEEQLGAVRFVQDNESKSTCHVLRGLHFQKPPRAQSKLVRVIEGEVLDVAVDLRYGSPWYGQHVACRLDGQRKQMLWIPKGFAHGFLVLSQEAIFSYKCDDYYSPEHEAGIRWDDPALGIDWGVEEGRVQVSAKDAGQAAFDEECYFSYEACNAETLYCK